MSTRINTNVTALVAAQNVSAASNILSSSLERLSSGLRINSAADDPAGLAISQGMTAQLAGITQATQNANDATNLIKTAEGALNQVQNLIISIRQLAVAASNQGAVNSTDIAAEQSQINSALQSIDQIAATTSYGGKNLLDGSATGANTTTPGTATTTSSQFNIVSEGEWTSNDNYTNVSINAATAAKFTIATGGINPTGGTQANITSSNVFFNGSIKIDGTTYSLSSTSQHSLSDLNTAISGSGYTATLDGNNNLVLTNNTGGAQINQTVDASNLVISGNAPVTAPGNANLLDFGSGAGPGLLLYLSASPSGGPGGVLPENLSSVDSSTAISVSGTISFSDGTTTFQKTYGYGTKIDQLQQDLDSQFGAGSFTVQTDSGGDLALLDNRNGGGDSLTNTSSNSDFVAYNTASVGNSSFTNGANGTMTLTDANGNSLTSSVGVSDSGSTFYGFANGLVVSSSVTASTLGSTQLTGTIATTAGKTTAGTTLLFQVGANAGQTVSEQIQSVETDQLGLGASSYVDANGSTQTPWASSLRDVNVTSFKGAQDAIAVADKALNDISTLRANLGALQSNVLQSKAASLQTASQNVSASISTIRDVDLSSEIVTYTKAQILLQAGTSALSQANQAPRLLLKLLH